MHHPKRREDLLSLGPALGAGSKDQMQTKVRLSNTLSLITAQHTIHQVTQRAPEVLAAGKLVLVNEEDVVLEAGV